MAGIDKTLEVFSDLTNLGVSGVEIAKSFRNGVGVGAILGSVGKLVTLGKSVEELIKDLPACLPELTDLDGLECSKIGQASYALVKRLIETIKE